jgi:hypothetical protein
VLDDEPAQDKVTASAIFGARSLIETNPRSAPPPTCYLALPDWMQDGALVRLARR